MEPESNSLAVCDANVLIDFVAVDEDLIRELVKYWGRVFVPDVVLNEVKAIKMSRAEELGLTILETPLSVVECKTLTFADRACLHFAFENQWVCLANDSRLRKECTTRGVEAVWGMKMLVLLSEVGQITIHRALECGEKIHRLNPAITTEVLSQFRNLLRPNGKVECAEVRQVLKSRS